MKENQECQEFACARKAKMQSKRNGRWYCSDLCAQQDSRSRGESTGSIYTPAKSTSPERGEVSTGSWHDELPKEPAQKESAPSAPLDRESITTPTSTEVAPCIEPNPSCGTGETPKGLVPTIVPNTSDTTRYEGSVEQLQSLDGAKSASMSLLDDSIRLMHGLTKHVVETQTGVIQQGEFRKDKVVDPAVVNAACNAAKQMGDLMKLKLKYHKEARKMGASTNSK